MSDPVQFHFGLTPKAAQIVASFQTLPPRIVDAVVRGMNQGNQLALSKIQREHLTGEKGRRSAYPPEEHRLVTRTGRLRGSAWASDAQPISGSQVQSAIGSNVIYAAVHEFGKRIHHNARQMTVYHKTDARGNLVTRTLSRLTKSGATLTSPNSMLIFAKAGAKRSRAKTVQAKAYDVDMPERSPFRTGLAESLPLYKQVVSREIVAEWRKMQS